MRSYGSAFLNLLTPSLYGAASIFCGASAVTLGVGCGVGSVGVKRIVEPVFQEKLKLDMTKEIGNIEDFSKDYAGFLDSLFDRFDHDHNGEITQEEFKEGLIDFLDEILDTLCECSKLNGFGIDFHRIDKNNRSYLRKEIILGMYSFDDPENPEMKPGLKEELNEDFETLFKCLWDTFDINHNKKISKDDCVTGMYALLKSLHGLLHEFDRYLFAFGAIGATMLLLSGFCAYKHVSNSISD
jgi:hypothetical protein